MRKAINNNARNGWANKRYCVPLYIVTRSHVLDTGVIVCVIFIKAADRRAPLLPYGCGQQAATSRREAGQTFAVHVGYPDSRALHGTPKRTLLTTHCSYPSWAEHGF